MFSAVRNAARFYNPWEALVSFFFDLTHAKAPNEWAAVCPAGLGDTYLLCGLAEQVLQTHGGDSFVAYVKRPHLFIPKLFQGVRETHPLPSWFKTRYYKKHVFSKKNIFYAHFPDERFIGLIGYKGVTLIDCYRAMLRLPFDAPFTHPRLPTDAERHEARNWLNSRGTRPGKTVLMFPEAYSSPSISHEDVSMLQTKIKIQGLDSLVHRAEDATTAVPLPLMRAVAQEAGWAITVRSGLADVLSNVPCRLTVLYPDMSWHGGPFIAGTGLRAMGLSETAEELVMTPGYIDALFSS